MTQETPTTCRNCGQPLPPGALACPSCGALVYRERLESLSREGMIVEQSDPLRAAEVWAELLRLLPPESQQFVTVRQRIEALRQAAPSAAPFAPAGPKFDRLGVAFAKTGVSMLVSIVVYVLAMKKPEMSWMQAWTISIGFVLLILVHEMGHVVANLYFGVRSSPPIFIPFLGAVINLRQPFANAKVEAISGIGGPVAGTVGAIACFAWYWQTGSPDALRLAWFGFMMNLFNMLPVPPLDGGRVTAAVSPSIWILGLIGLGWLVYEDFRSGQDFSILVILLVIALPRIIATLKGRARQGPYFQIGRAAPVLIGAAYLALLAVLIVGRWYTERKLGMGKLM